MIVMRLRGRLGNQLFIYAFGRFLQQKYKMPLIFINNVNDTNGSSIDGFNIPKDVTIYKYAVGYKYAYYDMKADDYKKIGGGLKGTIQKEFAYDQLVKRENLPKMSCKQKYEIYRHKLLSRKCGLTERYQQEKKDLNRLSSCGIFVCENGWMDFPDPNHSIKNIFPFGYFQSERYFKPIESLLRTELRPKQKLDASLFEYVKGIEESNSVCLSIRMGDYLNNPVLGVCTETYYRKAIDTIYEMYPDATIYVFSDDIQAVKNTFKFKNNIVSEPMGNSEIDKLTYMSKCKHFILSNSSFSWWAQYLCDMEKKTVIAPNKWTKIPCPCDIYQDNWITIEV